MAINIKGYEFSDPSTITSHIEERSGIYVILHKPDENYHILDIGESSSLRKRLDTHDRSECWKRNANGMIYYSVYYTPHLHQIGRIEIEKELRTHYAPIPCGSR